MYNRLHHQRIQKVLESLDAQLLLKHQCLFGGGTALTLSLGEYRESVDIDFMVSSVDGYRELRSIVSSEGVAALMTRALPLKREVKIDQYGIRCALDVDGSRPIKFEIVFEGRVQLADPLPEDRVDGVWTLAMEDKVATKLMANSDRWADDAVWSRDLVDLAMLTNGGTADPAGVEKAMRAYGEGVLRDFEKARARLLERDKWLAACMKRMGMTVAEADLRAKISGMVVAPPAAPANPPRPR
ncbi:MAG: nucleotidyl transferase AbiEii/AbiGii toxin family protein [Rubrivivax sp.]|nr:nucleotidyl transferase AbiEii/AbiGii toxin family protein [Rubrivivax sp.]